MAMGIRKVAILSGAIMCLSFLIYKMVAIPPAQINGWVEDGFEELKETYRAIFSSGLDKGSAFAVHYRGRLVAHLWGGCKNFMCSESWRTDTTAALFSATNLLGGLCLAMLADQRRLNFSRPVAAYWPEFAAHGKAAITVADLLAHRSGLVGVEPALTLDELDAGGTVMSQRLAEQRPAWRPGTQAHFHAATLGLYVDELFRRADPAGRSCVHFLEREVIHPLRLDLRIGLRDASQEKRFAAPYSFSNLRLLLRPFLRAEAAPRRLLSAFFWRRNDTYKRLMSPVGGSVFGYAFQMNDFRRLALLSSNGISTVDSLARLMGLIAVSGQPAGKFPQQIIKQPDVIRQLMEPISDLSWMSSTHNLSFGRGIALIPSPASTWLLGYPGTGGQMAFADPVKKVGFAYLTNHLSPYSMGDDPRHVQLQETLYKIVQKLETKEEE